jgi:hypothetical protein
MDCQCVGGWILFKTENLKFRKWSKVWSLGFWTKDPIAKWKTISRKTNLMQRDGLLLYRIVSKMPLSMICHTWLCYSCFSCLKLANQCK